MHKDIDINKIRRIQDRIENIRKKHFKQTQEEFANRIGVTLNVYKNNVNHSKLPLHIENSDFLYKVSESTGISLSYLKLQTEDMYERVIGTPFVPIDFSKRKEKEAKIINYIYDTNNNELVNALHFLLLELPPQYANSYKEMILSTYHITSQLSFLKEPNLLNDYTFKKITDNLTSHYNMWVFKQHLLESEADEHLQKKRRHAALQKYIEALLILPEDYNKIDTSTPVRSLHFESENEIRICTKIYMLIKSWSQYKNNKFKKYELEIIEQISIYFE